MKKLIAVVLLVGLFWSVNVSYGTPQGDPPGLNKQDQTQSIGNVTAEGGDGGSVRIGDTTNTNKIDVDVKNNNDITNNVKNSVKNTNENTNENVNENSNENANANENNSSATNHGNSVSITDTTINPTQLLAPGSVAPMYRTIGDELTMTTSMFKLQRAEYTVTELTRFANPGRCLSILWSDWESTYQVEVAVFTKEKAVSRIRVVVSSDYVATNMTKIGEAQAYSKKLCKSEHQAMAAMAVKAAEAGAKLVVFRTFSNPVTKVSSAVLGGGGAQTAGSTSVFNGATGIGSSTGEKLSRAYVVAELYR